MINLLSHAVQQGLLRAVDRHFAYLIAGEQQPLLAWLVAGVSVRSGEGHVCLELTQLTSSTLFAEREPELAAQLWQCAGSPTVEECIRVLQNTPAVGDGSIATPLVLQGTRLYLQRLWQDEGIVAHFFRQSRQVTEFNPALIPPLLDRFFKQKAATIDWQKIATVVALTSSVTVIAGGPGTGKTFTIVRLLAALIGLFSPNPLRCCLAAPTGKAAARLIESLGALLPTLPLSADEKAQFPMEATTLHRLLGMYSTGSGCRYNESNPLHLDVLIIDEASMVDLRMMARVIMALPSHARLILVGDHEQLASVEAGAVLAELCRVSELGYSPQRANELSELSGYSIEGRAMTTLVPFRDQMCLLRDSYRFEQQSGIASLAYGVKQGDMQQVIACFKQGYQDIEWKAWQMEHPYAELIQHCVKGYTHYLRLIQQAADPKEILAAFGQFQLLCALRQGHFGVSGLNMAIEQALQQANLITQTKTTAGNWYAGRPIIIGRNSMTLGLFNGDVGIALSHVEGALRVYFSLPDGNIKSVQANRLPEHETVYAMTVHKSQGSEFTHVVLVLPKDNTALLSRELVYTALTRARQRLTLYASEAILRTAIQKTTERQSGLAARLQQL